MNHLRGQTTRGTFQVPEPRLSSEAYQLMKWEDLLKFQMPSLNEPSPAATSRLKIEIAYAYCNVINTLYI
jgi:hypothetical protein